MKYSAVEGEDEADDDELFDADALGRRIRLALGHTERRTSAQCGSRGRRGDDEHARRQTHQAEQQQQ